MPNLHAFGDWLLTALLYVPRAIFSLIVDALNAAIDAIFLACSVCDFASLGANFAALPVATLFIMGWFKVGTGLTIISAAYGVRFLIRRLPFIG